MDDFPQILRSRLDAGASLEEALAHLREVGSNPVSTIKAICNVLEVDLREAKQIFGGSPAWQPEAEAGRQLHEQIAHLLDTYEDDKPSHPLQPADLGGG